MTARQSTARNLPDLFVRVATTASLALAPVAAPDDLGTRLVGALRLLGQGLATVFFVLGTLTGMIYLVGLLRDR